MLNLYRIFPSPVMIAAIEILRVDKNYFVRTTSTDGASGIAVTNEHAAYLYPLLQQRIAPCFLGKDARDLETLVDRAYTHKSNYKLAGLALWNCIAYVELSLFDLLGKLAGKSVGDLLGGIRRRQIPIYLSSLRRDTTPEEEVTWISERIAETQAKAVKLKVGGRMSGNADAFPGRSEKLITLARKTWGDAITIYVDANGSYDAAHAIEVGQVLQSHGVALFEEPCPFDEYEQTKQVADALTMMVSGGEQDTSFARFRWMIQNRGVDLVQPDIIFNGGFIRALRVARLAQAAEMMITPHCPRANPQLAYMLHFASVVPNLGPFQEFRAEKPKSEWWRAPSFQAHDGVVAVPSGPGLGVEYDPTMWNDAEIV